MWTRRSIGVIYNPGIPGTEELVALLVKRLGLKEGASVYSVNDLEQKGEKHPGVDLLVTVGGDGTILRVVHTAAPHGVAILGINMGRVGFMTELSAEDALERIGHYLDNDCWVEERTMLKAQVVSPHRRQVVRMGRGSDSQLYHALNEAVIGSSAVSRLATIEVVVDNTYFATYRADSVIVATATGSTGYSLSAGGPILHPVSRDILLKPVAPYLGHGTAMVLSPTSRLELTLRSDTPAVLSLDGFIDIELYEGDQVWVEVSPYVARFLRAEPSSRYYEMLRKRFGLGQGDTLPQDMF